jgi:hypothetical protein
MMQCAKHRVFGALEDQDFPIASCQEQVLWNPV